MLDPTPLRRLPRFDAIILAACCAIAPAHAQATGQAADKAATTAVTTTPVTGSAKLARADAAFLRQAAQNGNAEIEASKLALTKTASPEIKTFARQMVDEHTKTGEALKSLALAKGVAVSDTPSLAQSAKIKLLDAMSGANFDKRYASMIGLTAHRNTVRLFQRAAGSAKDAEVKAFASTTLPALQHHLQMAQALNAGVEGKS